MAKPKSVTKLKNNTLLVEVTKETYLEVLLKKTYFYNLKIKAYPHKYLDTSKWAVRSLDFSACTLDEIKTIIKQSVTDVCRISIKKNGKTVNTNT